MDNGITDLLSIWDGVVRDGTLYLLCGSDQLAGERAPHTMLVEYRGKPVAVETLGWTARDIAVDPDHPDGAIVMGLNGEIARFRGGKAELLPPVALAPRGTLLFLGQAGGQLMACGGNQQVYRSAGADRWVPFDRGISRPEDNGLSQFEFILGDPLGPDLYTGGARGEAWQCAGSVWRALDLPVNVRLVAAAAGPDGRCWIAGQLGVLLCGSGDEWEVLHQDESIPYFWDLAFLGERLFLASDRVLYEWKDGRMSPVNFADPELYDGPIPYSFYKLAVDHGQLYSFGAKDVLRFDGSQWHRLI
jgi:hypothetical protein